ncbi:hypothetical protein DID88_002585 [Monilinia fructigena]|uniref:Sin3 binding protein n=1 Tax=Monilinia fructigena TaxID=38457 RepID=A0A395IUR7_9HELO|nr:hypothetical protein DID88_002585 [Monilinia fructigena]
MASIYFLLFLHQGPLSSYPSKFYLSQPASSRYQPFGTRSPLPQLNLEHVDSDLDLHDGSGTEGTSDIGSPGLDTTGAITPSLLAKHHLPEILLDHGPLAIRHIMGYLTTSVPGFSGIPPAKARRLVVGALEGRGNGGEAGGVKGNVLFEKVGWGRWDARLKGHPARMGRAFGNSPHRPSLPDSYPIGMPIANNQGWSFTRTRLNEPGSSWAGDSTIFSHRDDVSMPDEADKMSLDGDQSDPSSSESEEDVMMEDDPDDVTDEEDWAAVGAQILYLKPTNRYQYQLKTNNASPNTVTMTD